MFKRIFLDAFSLVFWNLETVFKTCGAWFALQFVLALIANALSPDPQNMTVAGAFANILILIAAVLSWPSIAVAWHRFALFGEQPGMIHLRFGALEFRFLLKTIVIGLIAMVMFIPVGAFLVFVGGLSSNMFVPLIIGLLAALFIGQFIMRFNLVLPATAVERPIGFGEAFTLGEGLGLPMILATLALSIPFVVISALLTLALAYLGGGLPVILIQMKVLILNLLLQIIITVLGISVITAGYKAATERQDPTP
ncbi:hypothetical protein [Roseibium sp.]|uniref:hypothetical protein n=1 Tax=Roseibium sp. TaxID=1936156 RepID=UPI003A97A6D2